MEAQPDRLAAVKIDAARKTRRTVSGDKIDSSCFQRTTAGAMANLTARVENCHDFSLNMYTAYRIGEPAHMANSSETREWWNSPLGKQLLEQEQRVVADSLEDIFGLQLLQVGAWGGPGEFFTAARTQRQTVISTVINDSSAGPASAGRSSAHLPIGVCAKPSELPVASDSVDAVLLPHTLEFEKDPYAVLREVDRVLVGDGKLLILGFNPFSPWGLRHRFAHQGFPPGLVRLLSEYRLRDWLALLSFEVTDARRYAHQLPRPLPANAYLLKAHKRVYTLTAVKPRWREKPRLVGGLVEPTTRVVHHRGRGS